jgi:hypothetical protein
MNLPNRPFSKGVQADHERGNYISERNGKRAKRFSGCETVTAHHVSFRLRPEYCKESHTLLPAYLAKFSQMFRMTPEPNTAGTRTGKSIPPRDPMRLTTTSASHEVTLTAHDEIFPENVRLISCSLQSSSGRNGFTRLFSTRIRNSARV